MAVGTPNATSGPALTSIWRPGPQKRPGWANLPASVAARALVVDPDSEVAGQLGAWLQAQGHMAHVVGSMVVAFQILENDNFDIVVIDGEAFGPDAVSRLTEHYPLIEVVAALSQPCWDLAVDALCAGAADWVPKPVSEEFLALVVARVLHHRDLERSARERDHYEQLSRVDGLTGLYNHRYLHQLLDGEIPRSDRYGHRISLFMIDVDDFKRYNDVNGHPAGDKLLRQLSQLLKEHTRETDHVARYGGEEFVIVLTETDKSGAGKFAGRLVQSIERTQFDHEESQRTGRITVSIGVATYPEDAVSKAELIERADVALYKAKAGGKNQACVYAGDATEPKPGADAG